MNQLVVGLIAGIIGGLIVLLLGLSQKKKNKINSEINVGKEWNKTLMFFMLILTGVLPLTGLILGIVGLIFQSKRKQGMFLMFFSVCIIAMYVLMKPFFSLIFCVLIAIIFLFFFKKYTPKSIAIAFLIFIILAVSYYFLINSDGFHNEFADPLGLLKFY